MAEKKQESFTVTDRRLFTTQGEPRTENEEQEVHVHESVAPPAPAQPEQEEMPAPPTSAEQKQQADAYKKSSQDLDSRLGINGHSAKDLEVTFERFLASLYMTAMVQLGLMHEQGGQPQIDLIGGRQTIDTISLLAEKTKGNLTATEQNLLQNSLYELRMAYVEVTNALSRPPQATGTDVKPHSSR